MRPLEVVTSSVTVAVCLRRDGVGVTRASFGVDIQRVRTAPLREFVRVYECLDDDFTACLELDDAALRELEPFIVTARQLVAVGEQVPEP